MAHALEQQGDRDEAIAVFDDLRRLRPDNGRHLSCQAVALKARGRSQEAAPIFEAAVAANRAKIREVPEDLFAHANLGFALIHQGKLEEASAEYRQAIRIRPDYAGYHNNLGVALARQGKLDEAVVEYRAATRIQPDFIDPHLNLGTLRYNRKHGYTSAEAEFRAAIRLQPDHASAHNNLGVALERQGKLEEAVAEHRAAVQLETDNANAHDNLGWALQQQGKLEEASQEYRAAIRIQPDYASAHDLLGEAFEQQGRWEEAITEFRAVARLRPESDEAHNKLGDALAQQRKLEEATAQYRAAFTLGNESAGAHNGLAWRLARPPDLGRLRATEALEHAHKAVSLVPANDDYHTTLALAEYRAGHFAEAIAAARRALEQGGAHAGYRSFFLAMAHWRRGETDRARCVFDRAVAWTRTNDPRNAELLQFWREAAALLGRNGPDAAATARLPADVFAH
jgi:tetratricopeptide (TPR) repeat protein